jgi:hypothetical protein
VQLGRQGVDGAGRLLLLLQHYRVMEFLVAYPQITPLLLIGVRRTAREDLEARIMAQGGATTVYIRFDEIEAMTISLADEFLGRFYSSMAAGDVATAGVLLSGFNEETREAVAICLERRDVIALAVDNNQTRLMGRIESLVDTFRAVLGLGEFRANDLATALSITPQNANNRLKRLVEAGALQRRQASVSNRGGKEFVYSVVQARTGQPT